MRKRSDKPAEMTNAEISSLLLEVADRLHAQAANPFRVAAYRNAASIIRDWPEPVSDVFAREGPDALRESPGVGKSRSVPRSRDMAIQPASVMIQPRSRCWPR